MMPTSEVQGFYFRIYTVETCPHCKATLNLFIANGVPIQEVIVDKLLEHAIPKVLNQTKIETPIVINHINGELCVGNHKDIYLKWIELYHAVIGGWVSPSLSEEQLNNRIT